MYKFTEKEINELYNSKVKLNTSYFTKKLPQCPLKCWNYSWKGHDAPRCLCVIDFIEWVKKYNLTHVKVLNVLSKGDPELEFVKADKINEFSYEKEGHDLHNFHNKEKCDFFIFNQTIEHLYNPFICIKNIYENLNYKGYVFTSVPTNVIPHSTPIHFANWTPMGLAMLFKTNGFEIKEMGQWGNKNYIHYSYGNRHDFPDIIKCGSNNE